MVSDPVVIGAGPAGLAVAATLARQGQRCVVLERADSVGASWQGRYDSLRLHTVRWLSGLPGAPITRRYGRWVARDDVVAYLRDYAERFGVRPEFGVDVVRVDRTGSNWTVRTSRGDFTAPAVVVATGYSRVPSQLLGIARKHAPEQVMNPLTRALRRVSVPDLSSHGLPAPAGDGFTQFLRTRTVPILDHGFVDAVRAGRITVVADVERFDG